MMGFSWVSQITVSQAVGISIRLDLEGEGTDREGRAQLVIADQVRQARDSVLVIRRRFGEITASGPALLLLSSSNVGFTGVFSSF